MTQRHSTWSSPATLLGLFVLGAAASLIVSVFAAAQVLGMSATANRSLGVILTSAILCSALLLLSRTLLHREGESLRELGLFPQRSRLQQFGFGFVVSAPVFMLVAVAQSASISAAWEFQGMLGARAALLGLAITTLLALAEELVFRGLALRYLRALFGDRNAVILSALSFGIYHLVQSDDWAMGAAFRFLMPTLGGLVFGWAAVKSKGLALPLGLHLGGNWVQASVASFVPAGGASSTVAVNALWHIPISTADARALSAPDLLPHLPYLIALALTAAATWRWFASLATSPQRLTKRRA